ncbi:carotenoid oxygenase family protein [Tsuneonella sp. HG222]
MTLSYADRPALRGPTEPARFDSEVFDCEVVGALPKDLSGVFYRVGGEWFYPPRFADDSPFAADGIASQFRIHDGSCDFTSRFVRTPRYLANRAAREQLFGYYRNPFTDDPRVAGVSGTVSNTNIVYFAGRLLSLKEDALPYELDPETLETRGPFDFGGGYRSPTFTAHPKVDGKTGEMITYGYEAEGLATNAIWLYTIDPAGKVTSERRIKAPYLSMVHDIALSQNYILIPVYGMVSSMERLRAGKVHWGWDSSVPSYIGVVPRSGEGEVRWFEGPEMAMVHTFSASDRDGVITLHAAVSDSNPFPFFPEVSGAPFDPAGAATTVRKYTLDTRGKAKGWREEKLFADKPGSLSRIDDRLLGHDYRYGFLGYSDAARPFEGGGGRRPVNSYGKFDFTTGAVQSLFAGPTHSLGEIAFAPRSPTAPEGDGWILGLATNYADMHSELIVGDTRDLAAGPVARVRLPFKAPGQIHGNWVPTWSFAK